MDSPVFNILRQKFQNKWEDFLQKYEFEGEIGSGGFGIVYKAHERSDRLKTIAVKQYKFRSIGSEGVRLSCCREIALLRELKHENVIDVLDTVIDPGLSDDDVIGHEQDLTKIKIMMVFPYCKHDVWSLAEYHRNGEPFGPRGQALDPVLPPSVIKSIIWQTLNGLAYLHRNWIVHRDIKPANLFVNEKGQVKIGDFGLARIFRAPLRPLGMDGHVVTIWYRPPELLLGANHYTPSVDIWSVGCVLFELLTGDVLFEGQELKGSDKKALPFQSEQLGKIFGKMGTPRTEEDFPHFTSMRYYSECLQTLGDMPRDASIFNQIHDPLARDLVGRMLVLNPVRRITCADAMRHRFFSPDTGPFDKNDIFRYVRQNKYPEHRLRRRRGSEAPQINLPQARGAHRNRARAQPAPQPRRFAVRRNGGKRVRDARQTGYEASSQHPRKKRKLMLVLNLGCEMLYVLEQRLTAQSIPESKARRVLREITEALLGDDVMAAVFKPQAIYSLSSTREVMNRLSHSSIMSLSETSMSKLFDLIFMALKYQIIMCSIPEEIVQVTLNHFDFIRSFYSDDELPACFHRTLDTLRDMVAAMSHSEFVQLRKALLRFFMVRNVRVGVFLANGIQKRDGTFDHKARKRIRSRRSRMDRTLFLDFSQRVSDLGKNLFIRKGAGGTTTAPSAAASAPPPAEDEEEEEDVSSSSASDTDEEEPDDSGTPRLTEMNLIAETLGGVGSRRPETEEDGFSLAIVFEAPGVEEDLEEVDLERRDRLIVVSDAQRSVTVSEFDDLIAPAPATSEGGEDDLMALLDS